MRRMLSMTPYAHGEISAYAKDENRYFLLDRDLTPGLYLMAFAQEVGIDVNGKTCPDSFICVPMFIGEPIQGGSSEEDKYSHAYSATWNSTLTDMQDIDFTWASTEPRRLELHNRDYQTEDQIQDGATITVYKIA